MLVYLNSYIQILMYIFIYKRLDGFLMWLHVEAFTLRGCTPRRPPKCVVFCFFAFLFFQAVLLLFVGHFGDHFGDHFGTRLAQEGAKTS